VTIYRIFPGIGSARRVTCLHAAALDVLPMGSGTTFGTVFREGSRGSVQGTPRILGIIQIPFFFFELGIFAIPGAEFPQAAGVREPEPATQKVENKDEEFTCPGCFEDVTLGNTTALNCTHRFCNNCWTVRSTVECFFFFFCFYLLFRFLCRILERSLVSQTYISMKINEGQARNIRCMVRPFQELFLETRFTHPFGAGAQMQRSRRRDSGT
jgi:hypothetical protein